MLNNNGITVKAKNTSGQFETIFSINITTGEAEFKPLTKVEASFKDITQTQDTTLKA